jgi:hypothetical protein
MAGQYSQAPQRCTSGSTSDAAWQPLADDGQGNPFFYHGFQDDFDNALSSAGLYTITNVNSGTVAHTAGDGGLALFTTGIAAGNSEQIQLPAASFSLTLGKKLFYLTRIQLAAATTSAFFAGLINTTSTIFPSGVTDGIYFSKAAGSTQLVINSNVGGVNVSANVANANFANGVNMDMAFYLNRQGDVLAFAAGQLVGYIPSAGTGANTPPQAGPNTRLIAPPLTGVNLNLTMAVSNGATAAATTMTSDFHLAHKER